ncbi:hypothetical protein K1F50_14775 [Muricauda oceani]|uniref:Uncharacterized protein n=1 Tax=Flagellimonas oceani TaxID=2698672 RepID=A0A6G7J2E4_9FLAO|nr:DUF6520 family protein [Allomuricauda oceani]MBW8244070.1 hypothetical protein [Allomuricauda oceani]QII45043.1 hypothetical protein GVT53_10240 [Allomuricauda oceani]
MKTRAIKFFIPALAIVFAIAASAFTAMDTQADEFTLIDGYIETGDPQQPCELVEDVDCQLTGNQDCTYSVYPYPAVYQFEGETMCTKQLSRTSH